MQLCQKVKKKDKHTDDVWDHAELQHSPSSEVEGPKQTAMQEKMEVC